MTDANNMGMCRVHSSIAKYCRTVKRDYIRALTISIRYICCCPQFANDYHCMEGSNENKPRFELASQSEGATVILRVPFSLATRVTVLKVWIHGPDSRF